MEWFIFESIDRELERFRCGVNKNHPHNHLDPLATDEFVCKEASKHPLEFPFKSVQHSLNFE
jgi:hypothetical protein